MSGKIEHHGIKIEFVGQIELYYDRGNHGHQQEVFCQVEPCSMRVAGKTLIFNIQVLFEPGACGRGGEEILQTAGDHFVAQGGAGPEAAPG